MAMGTAGAGTGAGAGGGIGVGATGVDGREFDWAGCIGADCGL